MTPPPLVTQAHVEDILRRLGKLETRVGRTQVRERNDYSFSTYTPTYLGETTAGATTYAANGQVGYWRQYGDMIYAFGRVEWTAATGTGNAIISLPFASANVTNLGMPGSLDVNTVTFAAGTPTLLVPINSAFFRMRSPASNAASTNVAVEAAGIVNFGALYLKA
jgi:hypothetical protein